MRLSRVTATTTSGAAVFTYDLPTTARIDGAARGPNDAGPAPRIHADEVSALRSVKGQRDLRPLSREVLPQKRCGVGRSPGRSGSEAGYLMPMAGATTSGSWNLRDKSAEQYAVISSGDGRCWPTITRDANSKSERGDWSRRASVGAATQSVAIVTCPPSARTASATARGCSAATWPGSRSSPRCRSR